MAANNINMKEHGKKSKFKTETMQTPGGGADEEPVSFDPPLYKQRYLAVTEILKTHSIKSMVDFGISEANVFTYYKGVPTLESIIGVDIDEEVLVRHKHKLRPLNSEYLYRRPRPLRAQLMTGSLVDYDVRTSGVEAVCMIEVIEHLEEDVLTKTAPSIFGRIKPRLAILTTPNSEFNVVFPNFTGFRHPDHKFEWTRAEFQQWCNEVCSLYGYTVSYSGVGEPPAQFPDVGCCSQIAVFQRLEVGEAETGTNIEQNVTGESCKEDEMPYKLICEVEYPYSVSLSDSLSVEVRILQEAQYYINMLASEYRLALARGEVEPTMDVDERRLEISLETLLSSRRVAELCPDQSTLREVLLDNGVPFTSASGDVIVHWLADSDSDDEDDLRSDENDFNADNAENDGVTRNADDKWDIDDDATATWGDVTTKINNANGSGDSQNKREEEDLWDDLNDSSNHVNTFIFSPPSSPPRWDSRGVLLEHGQFEDAECHLEKKCLCFGEYASVGFAGKCDCSSLPCKVRKDLKHNVLLISDSDVIVQQTERLDLETDRKFNEPELGALLNQNCDSVNENSLISTSVQNATLSSVIPSDPDHTQHRKQPCKEEPVIRLSKPSEFEIESAANILTNSDDRVNYNDRVPSNISSTNSVTNPECTRTSSTTTNAAQQNLEWPPCTATVNPTTNATLHNIERPLYTTTGNTATNATVQKREFPPNPSAKNSTTNATLHNIERPLDTSTIKSTTNAVLQKLERPIVLCIGCGCEITKVTTSVTGDNLCGLSARCLTSFTQRIRAAQEQRAIGGLNWGKLAGQFEDV